MLHETKRKNNTIKEQNKNSNNKKKSFLQNCEGKK